MERNKSHIQSIISAIGAIYTPIFVRIIRLFSDSEKEWNIFKQEQQTYIDVLKKYFLPLLVLLVLVHLFSICMSSFFQEIVFESKMIFVCFYQTAMVSLMSFFFSCFAVLFLLGRKKFNLLYVGNIELNLVASIIIFPFCIQMVSQMLVNIWEIFFFVDFIAFILSYILVWVGLIIFIPALDGQATKHKWVSLVFIVVPLLFNKVLTGVFNKLMQ